MYRFLVFCVVSLFVTPVFAADSVTMGGRKLQCPMKNGFAHIQIDRSIPSEAAAEEFGGDTLYLNPVYMNRQPAVVRWWIFWHECGHLNIPVAKHPHQDELNADTFAAEEGVKAGWLTKEALKPICDSWEDAPASREHPSGRTRCLNVNNRFAEFTEKYAPAPSAKKDDNGWYDWLWSK